MLISSSMQQGDHGEANIHDSSNDFQRNMPPPTILSRPVKTRSAAATDIDVQKIGCDKPPVPWEEHFAQFSSNTNTHIQHSHNSNTQSAATYCHPNSTLLVLQEHTANSVAPTAYPANSTSLKPTEGMRPAKPCIFIWLGSSNALAARIFLRTSKAAVRIRRHSVVSNRKKRNTSSQVSRLNRDARESSSPPSSSSVSSAVESSAWGHGVRSRNTPTFVRHKFITFRQPSYMFVCDTTHCGGVHGVDRACAGHVRKMCENLWDFCGVLISPIPWDQSSTSSGSG